MNLFTFLIIILLIINGVVCYLTNRRIDHLSILPRKSNYPLQEIDSYEQDEQSVYDPGVDIDDIPMSLIDSSLSSSSAAAAASSSSSLSSPSLLSTPNLGSDKTINNKINIFKDNNGEKSYSFDDGLSNTINIYDKLRNDIKEEEEIAMKSSLLLNLLEETTTNDGPLPVVYFDEQVYYEMDQSNDIDKRAGRYYRRYPWKRQNTKHKAKYDADSRHLCVPSREEVFKLLIGLHENRNGNKHKTVNFCNKKRPAKAIFTNIRFLG